MSKIFNYIKTKINNLDFLLITASTVICSLISFVLTVYSQSIIGPEIRGIYSECLIVVAVMNYAQLGVLNAYNRDYPQALGKKDTKLAQNMKNSAITFMLMIYMAILVVFELGVIIYFHGKLGVDDEINYQAFGLAMCPILVLLKSFDDMSNSTVRMNGKYNYAAIIGLIRTIIAFGVGVVAIKYGGYYGLYAMATVSSILGIIMFHSKSLKGARLSFDFSYMKQMVLSGWPLLANSLIWTLVQQVDKLVIRFFINRRQLGVYSIANMGFTTMILVPQSISQVFYIKISHLFGAHGDKRELLDKAREFTKLTAALTGGACILVFYIMPLFVAQFMPMYTEGTPATQILIIGVAIYSTTMLYGNIFSILKLNKSLLANSIALLIFNVVFSSSLVLFAGRTINMVAVGTGISYALYSLMLMVKLSRQFDYSLIKLMLSSWLPLISIVAPAVAFYMLIDNLVVAAIMSCFVTILVYAIILAKRRKANA